MTEQELDEQKFDELTNNIGVLNQRLKSNNPGNEFSTINL